MTLICRQLSKINLPVFTQEGASDIPEKKPFVWVGYNRGESFTDLPAVS
jgi:hypothetical protein